MCSGLTQNPCIDPVIDHVKLQCRDLVYKSLILITDIMKFMLLSYVMLTHKKNWGLFEAILSS
ncbi:hypothetical protein NC651_016510 [Populus alba x Populus x berolinensis]|nr:hypothetical protein NC651_016510 [Populus alba x Populus x berolinensis]